MQLPSNSAAPFFGESKHVLDGKNRVTIPSKWRHTEADEFYLVPDSNNTCLRAMPPEEFNSIGDKAAQLPNMTPKEHRTFLRHFYSRSQHVVADKQGRLLLPEEYCQQFGLRGEIVLVGAKTVIEMWNLEAWRRTQGAEEPKYKYTADQLGI
jgi:MraZ protein